TLLGRAQASRMLDLQHAQEALTKQATHDSLTGLPNRALLVDRIDRALAQARRSGRWLAVLFVDLDRFKQVNDTHGHAAGDVVLRRVANQLVVSLRAMDTVSRLGGDEFVILAPDLDDYLHAFNMAKRLVGELGRRPDDATDAHRVAASIGISISRGRGTAESMLSEADTAMYRAKSLGGDRVQVYDAALGEQVKQRSATQQMLQSAMDDNRVVVYYQPVIEVSDGATSGFEALVRLRTVEGSIVAPSEFIPVAEESGLVVPLGAQVLAIACAEASRWPATQVPGRPLTVAVNLSARQLESGDLAADVKRQLELSGLDPQCLHLELTETAIMELLPETLDQLGRIRALGVQIGLDDFGTGYASLTHLRRLPLTFVKIDRSFVQGLGVDQEDERIVSAVVDLAANLGLRSIAEGVETVDQFERLRQLGCNQAQGYLFAHPLPAAEIEVALAHAAF
ncbi:MAG: putative signaling protein, partial [Acidimicrobiia bacterium]|nr:putative signaling protein [Acidimicrobiia bacterium]